MQAKSTLEPSLLNKINHLLPSFWRETDLHPTTRRLADQQALAGFHLPLFSRPARPR
ncbi:MAG: hypothetical protein ACE5HD_07260 [Acidobacteriota bacterium]